MEWSGETCEYPTLHGDSYTVQRAKTPIETQPNVQYKSMKAHKTRPKASNIKTRRTTRRTL